MKIIIPMDTEDVDATINDSFGRANFFLLYDQKTKTNIFIPNEAKCVSGGAGIQAAQIVVDSKADIIITPRLGKKAADIIKLTDIKCYTSIDKSARENIEAYSENKLEEMTNFHQGKHGGNA